MKITIELSEKEVEELYKFMCYAKMCGSLMPDVDPTQKVGLIVLKEIAKQRQGQGEEIPNDGA